MNEQAADHEAKVWTRREARTRCRRCGGRVESKRGQDLDPLTHFEGLVYQVCVACGHERVKGGHRR